MSDRFFTPHNVQEYLGQTFTSGWHLIDQRRISVFGANTDDPDPHHVDPAFAARHSAHGKTIAFGFPHAVDDDGDAVRGEPLPAGRRRECRVAGELRLSRDPLRRARGGGLAHPRATSTVAEVRDRKPGQKLFVLALRGSRSRANPSQR